MNRERIVILLALLLLVTTGCSSADQEGSVTERMRESVDPKAVRFLIEGQRALERGVHSAALALSDSAEHYAPGLADVHFLRGAIYTKLNQGEIARAAYETVLELDPAYKGAHYNLGLNAFYQGKLRDAIDFFKAEEALEATSNLYLEMGRAYAKLGEPDSARMAYEQAIALDSSNATAYMWLGQHYEEIGELEQALDVSRAGLQLRPDNLDYKYLIGSLLFRTEQVEEALIYLEPVALQRPWHHGAQYNFGQVLMRLGREQEAQRYFVLADSAQQLTQRINEAQQQVDMHPDSLDYWVNLGVLFRHAGQFDRAVEAYQVAVALEPWNLFLQNNLAILAMERGDLEGAIRRYQAILGVDSTLANVWLNLGVAYANAGLTAQAQAAWQNTLKYEPGHPTARAFLAQLAER